MAFKTARLVTEGVIYVVALVCTLIVLLSPPSPDPHLDRSRLVQVGPRRMGLRATVLVGLAAAVLSIGIDWAAVRAIYGDRFAGHASLHIRFGPNATVNRPGSPR